MSRGGDSRHGPAEEQPGGAENAALEPRWYAVRTRSRHEKKVHAQFAARPGIDAFLPLQERRSRWKDRIKRVQEPLFPGYCFARFGHPDRLRVLKVVGVVGLVGPSGEPEPIPDREIEAIRTLAGSRLSYEPFPFLAEGMMVEVIRGRSRESADGCCGRIVSFGSSCP